MESILLFTVNKKKVSLYVIYISIFIFSFIVYLIGKLNLEDISEIGFLIFGIPIVYTTLVYGPKKGILVCAFSLIAYFIGLSSNIVNELSKGEWESIITEGTLLPLSYYIGCHFLSRAVLNERNIVLKYRELSRELEKKHHSLRKQHLGILKTLTRTVDAKDSYTRGHSERVACYALAIAKEAGLSNFEQRDIFYAGALHDIGKIGIRDNVLCKPSSLTTVEMDEMKNHPSIGANIIDELEDLDNVKSYIFSHHERYEGFGYPLGLKGEAIPLGARIIAAADTYDAIISQRNYNRNRILTPNEAIEELKTSTPNQFDPEIIKVFIYLLHSERINLNFIECLNSLSI